MSLRLSGLNPLAYVGVQASQPPLLVQSSNAPTSKEFDFNIGTWWLVKNTDEIWILISVVSNVATWIQLFPGSSGGASIFPCNVGTATAAANILNVFGSTNIQTTGAGNTITIALTGTLALSYVTDSGTATPFLNLLGVVGGNQITTSSAGGGHTIQIDLDNGTNGQVLIGGGMGPLWRSITSSSIILTPGPNSLDLVAGTIAEATQIDTDAGNATFNAGSINVFGGTNINTSGAGDVLTVNLNNSVSLSGSLIADGTVTSGTGVTITSGGIDSTGTTRFRSLSTGVMQTDSTGLVSSTTGTDGQILIGATAGAPAWANITSSDGSVIINNGPNTIDIEANPGPARNAFFAYMASNYNITTGYNIFGTLYGNVTKLYDMGNNLDLTSLALYRAPVTGIYNFMLQSRWDAIVGSNVYLVIYMDINLYSTYPTLLYTHEHREIYNLAFFAGPVPHYTTFTSVNLRMTAGNAVSFAIQAPGPAGSSATGQSSTATTLQSFICGYLVQAL